MRSVYYYLLLFTLLHAQDPWGGVSVATPDNLNAITANPTRIVCLRTDILMKSDSNFSVQKEGFGLTLVGFCGFDAF